MVFTILIEDAFLEMFLISTFASLVLLSLIFRSGLVFRYIFGLLFLNTLLFLGLIFLNPLVSGFGTTELVIIFAGGQFFIVLVLGYLYKSRVVNSLKSVTKMTNRIADGDLTASAKDIQARGAGESRKLILSNLVLLDKLQKIISSVRGSSFQLADASEELASGSEEVAATTEEVTSTIQTIAEGAAEQVRRLDEVSNILTKMVSVTEESIRQISLTSKITLDLAEQTNLVSLNASIESAKAKESEGFQVVADHVRQLSIESKNAATSVNQISRDISVRMRQSVDQIVTAVEKIASVAENTAASAEEAAAAAQEQSASLQEITQQAQKLAEMSEKSERNVEEFRLAKTNK